jgi:hypothetical protein
MFVYPLVSPIVTVSHVEMMDAGAVVVSVPLLKLVF